MVRSGDGAERGARSKYRDVFCRYKVPLPPTLCFRNPRDVFAEHAASVASCALVLGESSYASCPLQVDPEEPATLWTTTPVHRGNSTVVDVGYRSRHQRKARPPCHGLTLRMYMSSFAI